MKKNKLASSRLYSKTCVACPIEPLEFRRLLTATLTNLAAFDGSNGSDPANSLIADSTGNLYGTTFAGGQNGDGTVFEVPEAGGPITTLATFDDTDGKELLSGVISDSNGNLYGLTYLGGANEDGTVYKLPAGSGSIDTLASFDGTNGEGPSGELIADSSGNLYGTTSQGGTNGVGTVFEISASGGSINTLATFDGTNGENPEGSLIFDSSGNLVGTAGGGGANEEGTAFEVPIGGGSITTLATFTDGSPDGGLISDASGNLYGTTTADGGTVFEIPAGGGMVTTLAALGDSSSGVNEGGVIFDSEGNLYGTTAGGGSNQDGSVYELRAGERTITTLGSFNVTNGSQPEGSLIADSDGNLYGTSTGGPDNNGNVFELSPGFVNAAATQASKLAFAQQPTAAAPGIAIAPAITVDVEDANGNIVSADNSTVTLSIASGPTGSTVGGTLTLAAVNGVATFSDITLSDAGAYTLTASDGALTAATSTTVTASSAASSGAVSDDFNLSGTRIAGSALDGSAVQVPTSDTWSDTDGPSSTGTFEYAGDSSNGYITVAGESFQVGQVPETLGAGVYTVSANVWPGEDPSGPWTAVGFFNGGNYPLDGDPLWMLIKATGDYQVWASGVDSQSGETEIASGTLPSTSWSQTAPPAISLVWDTVNNLASATVDGTAVLNSYSLAQVSGLTSSLVTEVGFAKDGTTETDLIVDNFSLSENGAVAVGTLAFAQPPEATSTSEQLPPVVLDVEDSNGNLVTTDNSNVTLSLASGPAGATLGGTTTVAAINGVATFSDLSISIPGNYTLVASDGGDVATTSTPFAVTVFKTIGGLDPGYGSDGLASNDVGFTSTNGLTADGDQSVLIGPIGTSPDESFGVTRYNADGSLDTTFGNGGVVSTAFGSTDAVPTAVDVLSNGDILVAGTATTYTNGTASGSKFAVAEYNDDGSLNTSFGTGGEVLVSFSSSSTLSNDLLKAMAVGLGGTIYLGGSSDAAGAGNPEFAVAALTAAGALDAGFGTGGIALLKIAGGDDSINGLALQSNGELVAAGSATANGVVEVALARFLTSGNLDPSFGVKGIVTSQVGGVYDAASSVALQSNGAIVIAGVTASGSSAALSSNFLVQRYTAAGRLDHSFAGGTVTGNFGQPSAATQVIVQSGGEIIVSGKTVASLASFATNAVNVAVARYTTRGALDTSFNGTGKVIYSLSQGVIDPAAQQTTVTLSMTLLPLDSPSLDSGFASLVNSSTGIVTSTRGGEILIGGSSGSNTAVGEAITHGVDLVAKLLSTLPASILGGAKGTATISITESGNDTAAGTVTLSLQLVTDPAGDGAVSLHSMSMRFSLKANQSHSYKVSFVYSASVAQGKYFLLASAIETGVTDLNPADNTVASIHAVNIAPPYITLAGSDLTGNTNLIPGKSVMFSLEVTNQGNVIAKGKTTVDLYLSSDQTTADGTQIEILPLSLALTPSKSKVYPLKFALASSIATGDYYLVAMLDSSNSLGSDDKSDVLVVDLVQVRVN